MTPPIVLYTFLSVYMFVCNIFSLFHRLAIYFLHLSIKLRYHFLGKLSLKLQAEWPASSARITVGFVKWMNKRIAEQLSGPSCGLTTRVCRGPGLHRSVSFYNDESVRISFSSMGDQQCTKDVHIVKLSSNTGPASSDCTSLRRLWGAIAQTYLIFCD